MTQLLEPHAGVRPRTSPSTASPEPARRSRSTLTVFGTACVAYLLAGWQLAIEHHAIVLDAMARAANASYVISSRDPHLAAVGFVWNPLPSFAALPFLALSPWFPELRTQAFASNIVSAIFMAGSVAVIWQILRELRIATVAMIALTALYAVHPIILEYGANGDSEATLVFFLALTCLGLMRWLERRDLNSLLLIGTALAFGYLSRQELLAAGGASLALILAVTYLDARGSARHRRWTAATEAAIAGMPFVLAIVCWAGSAWMIVGTALSYLDANALQVNSAQSSIASVVGGPNALDRFGYFLGELLLLEPLWSIIVVAALVMSWRRRDPRVLAPLVTFGAVAGAQAVLFGAGSTFGWMRFAITVVPLTIVCSGLLLNTRQESSARASARTPRRAGSVFTATLMAVAIVAALVAIPSAVGGMTTERFGREEAASVHLLPGYGWAPTGASYIRPHAFDGYADIARYFDRQHLRDGSVLTDDTSTFPLILASKRPRQFIIPSDYDFERSVADPAAFKVKYLLLSNGQTDALRSSYPIAGVGRKAHISVGTFVRSFDGGPFQLYLFRVTHSITG